MPWFGSWRPAAAESKVADQRHGWFVTVRLALIELSRTYAHELAEYRGRHVDVFAVDR